jgi:hypothetical protein
MPPSAKAYRQRIVRIPRQICRFAVRYERRASGIMRSVQPSNEIEELSGRDYWVLTAACLAVASVLLIGSAMVEVFGFDGTPIRDRIYAIAEQSSVLPPLLAVGAISMMTVRRSHARWPVTIARITAVVVIVAALYGLGYALFTHHEDPQTSGGGTYFAFVTENWGYRLSGALRFVSAGLLAIGAIVLSFRPWSVERSAVE